MYLITFLNADGPSRVGKDALLFVPKLLAKVVLLDGGVQPVDRVRQARELGAQLVLSRRRCRPCCCETFFSGWFGHPPRHRVEGNRPTRKENMEEEPGHTGGRGGGSQGRKGHQTTREHSGEKGAHVLRVKCGDWLDVSRPSHPEKI